MDSPLAKSSNTTALKLNPNMPAMKDLKVDKVMSRKNRTKKGNSWQTGAAILLANTRKV